MTKSTRKQKRFTYDNLILPVSVRSASELKKHTAGPGKRYVFCDHKNNPNGKLYAIARKVRNLRKPPMHVEMHSHTVDSLWMVLGDKEDLTGLRIEVVLGKKSYLLDSPASVYIPANVEHTYRFIQGSGVYINIVSVLSGEYNKTVL